jgi:PQQ-dependent catabolism-associated beta-propeller protein
VANENDSKASKVDIASKRLVWQTDVGPEPEGMAISPDGQWVICTSEGASLVHFIRAADGKLVDSVLVGTRPRAAQFTPDGRRLWVSSEARGEIAVFDPATHAVLQTIDFQADPVANTVQAVGIAMKHDGSRFYVALGRGDHVAEVDARTLKILRYFPSGSRNWGVALSPDESRLYAANGLSGDLSVIDLKSGRRVTTVKLGGRPWGVVVSQ